MVTVRLAPTPEHIVVGPTALIIALVGGRLTVTVAVPLPATVHPLASVTLPTIL